MKTLIISYLPRGARSNTQKILETFKASIAHHTVDEIDLTEVLPDMFTSLGMSAYIKRNYLGQSLSGAESASMARMDQMTGQFKNADIVVMAFPMHNFSVPAPIKAYFDSVMQKGETWDIGDHGYIGLMKGKKALILASSGGVYEGDMAAWNHATTLAETEFTFMGFDDVRTVLAAGTNLHHDKLDAIILDAQNKVKAIAADWYA